MTLAVVTGGESGIGAACAVRLAKDGADLVITYHDDREAADGVIGKVEAAGRRGLAVQCDVGDEQAVVRLFEQAAQLGTVEWLVNSAGLNMSDRPVAELEAEQFDQVVATDLRGPFLTCRELVRRLGGKPGRIVNISSIHGGKSRGSRRAGRLPAVPGRRLCHRGQRRH